MQGALRGGGGSAAKAASGSGPSPPPPPPHQTSRVAANHNPLREGAEDTPHRSAHKGAGR